MENIIEAIEDLQYTIEEQSIHNLKGDGTNWTIADSLEYIATSLNRIADSLENK